jgi:hypothetical protein
LEITFTTDEKAHAGNIAIYGKPGAGKTYSLRTLEKPERWLYINLEKGQASLGDVKFPQWDLTKLDDNLEKLKQFSELVKKLRTEEFKGKLDGFILDSATEFGEVLKSVYENDPKYKEAKMMLPRYGQIAKETMELFRALRDLDHYIKVYIFLSASEQDETGTFTKGLSYPGGSSQKIPALMDLVLYLGSEKDKDGNTQRRFLTQGTEKIIAKDRSGKLEEYEPADLGAIIKKINKN